jgi:hypothetical protein
LLVLTRQPNKAAAVVAEQLMHLFSSLPKRLRQTITFDNGTEFAYHHRLHRLAMRTFFCDPHAPWQKGGIENAIGRMRRCLPRKTDLATLPTARLLALVSGYNHTPRKCLDFRTPAEVFYDQLLHFKCDSTLPLSRERPKGRFSDERSSHSGKSHGHKPVEIYSISSCNVEAKISTAVSASL